MNQASTRSHCIFTIHLSSKEPGSATVRHAKLHLVDLAGSERVAKTGVGGQLLTEAKYINLSLHYLEQVKMGTMGCNCIYHVLIDFASGTLLALLFCCFLLLFWWNIHNINFIISIIFKHTILSLSSQCCVTITAIYFQNFFMIPNRNSVLIKQ